MRTPPSPTLKVKATSEPVTSTDTAVNGFPEGQIWQMSFHWIQRIGRLEKDIQKGKAGVL